MDFHMLAMLEKQSHHQRTAIVDSTGTAVCIVSMHWFDSCCLFPCLFIHAYSYGLICALFPCRGYLSPFVLMTTRLYKYRRKCIETPARLQRVTVVYPIARFPTQTRKHSYPRRSRVIIWIPSTFDFRILIKPSTTTEATRHPSSTTKEQSPCDNKAPSL
jgi:hypothetical protein